MSPQQGDDRSIRAGAMDHSFASRFKKQFGHQLRDISVDIKEFGLLLQVTVPDYCRKELVKEVGKKVSGLDISNDDLDEL